MPVVLAPAADLSALAGVLLLIGLLAVVAYTFQRLADVLNFSILGIHPLRNVGTAIENTIVAGCNVGISALEKVAKALWYGLTWMVHQFLDGLNELVANLPAVLHTLYKVAVPSLIQIAVSAIAKEALAAKTQVEALARTVGSDIARLDAKIDTKVSAAVRTAEADAASALKRAEAGINDEIRTLRSSVDQAIDHALNLARSESKTAVGELRSAENAAIGAIGSAQDATADELRNLIRELDPTKITAIIASVPLLAQLINVIAQESGLDSEACRFKVRQVCSTDPAGWGNLLAGLAPLAIGLSLRSFLPIARTGIRDLASVIRTME